MQRFWRPFYIYITLHSTTRFLSPCPLHRRGAQTRAGPHPVHGARHGEPRWWCRRAGPRGRRRPVVLHVRSDEMARRQGAAQRQLTRQHGRRHDARQPTGVLAGIGGVRAITGPTPLTTMNL